MVPEPCKVRINRYTYWPRDCYRAVSAQLYSCRCICLLRLMKAKDEGGGAQLAWMASFGCTSLQAMLD